MAIRIGTRRGLTPAAAHVVSFETGGGSVAIGMRRSASFTSPYITPASVAAPVSASPPSPPVTYNATRCGRCRLTRAG